MISRQKSDKEKNLRHPLIKKEFRAHSKQKTSKNNTTHTLLYSNIYEFAGNLEGILNVHYVGLIV